jgi:L-ascorbate metabolism protein UlaG (beta-lactamase superfamily)
MKKTAILFVLLFLTGLATSVPIPQKAKIPKYTTPLRRPQAPADFFGKPEEYLNWQAQNLLDMVIEVSERFPPQVQEPIERYMAMLMLDAVFHDVKAPERPAVQEFFHHRMEHAVKEMENTQMEEGAIIWKMYDMGYIVRTNTVTIGFDLIRGHFVGAEGFPVENTLMARIIDQCDVHFISHQHGDHSDLWVAQAFIDQGKPVVAPPDFWPEEPIFKAITHLEREADSPQSLEIQSGKRELKVVVYPGHQGAKVLNNVVLVISPEGLSFCQTGDQSYEEDFAWIDTVGMKHWIDVLMPNCWDRNPSRTAIGFNPGLIIPGHENELGHSIDHREAYALDYSRWQVPYPIIIMTWGESYHYIPKAR